LQAEALDAHPSRTPAQTRRDRPSAVYLELAMYQAPGRPAAKQEDPQVTCNSGNRPSRYPLFAITLVVISPHITSMKAENGGIQMLLLCFRVEQQRMVAVVPPEQSARSTPGAIQLRPPSTRRWPEAHEETTIRSVPLPRRVVVICVHLSTVRPSRVTRTARSWAGVVFGYPRERRRLHRQCGGRANGPRRRTSGSREQR
jgi:hypothetical protein